MSRLVSPARTPIVGGVVPLRSNWVNRQALRGSPISRVQYGYSPLMGKPERAMGTPTFERWVHYRAAGGVFVSGRSPSRPPMARRGRRVPWKAIPDWCLTSSVRPATIANARSAWGRSSAGRALPSQGRGRGFESPRLHQETSGGCPIWVPAFLCGTGSELEHRTVEKGGYSPYTPRSEYQPPDSPTMSGTPKSSLMTSLVSRRSLGPSAKTSASLTRRTRRISGMMSSG